MIYMILGITFFLGVIIVLAESFGEKADMDQVMNDLYQHTDHLPDGSDTKT